MVFRVFFFGVRPQDFHASRCFESDSHPLITGNAMQKYPHIFSDLNVFLRLDFQYQHGSLVLSFQDVLTLTDNLCKWFSYTAIIEGAL